MSLSPDMLGPYRIVRQVAVGGMAEIYLAQQRGLEGLARDVIIKKILPDHVDNPEFVAMFLDEARILASLNHPHIAQVLDLGKTDTGHYMVMEYVRGPTLKMLLGRLRRKRIPFPRPEALGIAMHIAEALHYAHRLRDEIGRPRGIVHRDLNPSNVILSYDGAAKLIDFGIAKASSKVHETRTGVIKGTFGYTAPEQLTGKPVDPRADIFCLGVLLYESCCNRHPFEASDEPDLLQRILNADYRRPSEVDSSIPSELDALISKCMAPKPEQRPKSMEAVIEGLSAFMARAGIVSTLAAISKFLHQAIPDDLQPSFVPTAAPARKRDVREPTMRKIPLDSVADASAGPSASTAQGSPSRPRPLASTAEGSLSRPRPLASTAEGSLSRPRPLASTAEGSLSRPRPLASTAEGSNNSD
ncbi:MAG: serine/threonine-protein kinase, partial [Myxococcota bacterium]